MVRTIHDGHLARYAFCVPLVFDNIVLDAGCGFGSGTALLAESAKEVIGIDIGIEEIKEAMRYYAKKNVKYIQGDVIALPFALDSFDMAIALEVIEHLDEIEQHQFLRELSRVVRPGGGIILSTPEQSLWHKMGLVQHDHKRELTKNEFTSLLSKYFTIEDFYGQWKFTGNSYWRDVIRTMFNQLKKADFLELRYIFFSRAFRKRIDSATSPVDQSRWTVEKLGEKELAAQLLVVCQNKKS